MARPTCTRLAMIARSETLPSTLTVALRRGTDGKEQAIMSASLWSATSFPAARPAGRDGVATRRGGAPRRAL